MGPAGLAATVYGASEGLDTMSLDSVATGGQAATSSRIENYLGFPSGISGADLAERATLQATKFGARMSVPARAAGIEHRNGDYLVRLESGGPIAARTVVIATGAQYRRLDVPGIERFEGTSVFYAATDAEARVCRGDAVAIVGGGNSAGQAALFLAQSTSRVTLVVREGDLSEHMSRYLIDRVERAQNIDVLLHTEVAEICGDKRLEGIAVVDNETGERRTIDARALFIFIGAVPGTAWLGDVLALDSGGYVLTGADVPSRGGGGLIRDASPTPSRRASPASSRSATCGTGPRCASPPPWAKGRWPSAWCTSTSPTATSPRVAGSAAVDPRARVLFRRGDDRDTTRAADGAQGGFP